MREKLASADERKQLIQDHLRQRMAELDQRHQQFVSVAARLFREIVRPRLERVVRHFENAEVLDLGQEGRRFHCSCRLKHGARFPATGELSLILSHDEPIENLLVIFHLEILPIFFQFMGTDQEAFLLENVDEKRLAQWVDDRLLSFVDTYLRLEQADQYQAENLVTDPVCGMRRIAYFSMEVGVDSAMPTYSGGLGVLAGDTLKSAADLEIPVVAVSLLSSQGYFDQSLDQWGNQREHPVSWEPRNFARPLEPTIPVTIEGRSVLVALGSARLERFHMNEGHASLLVLELLRESGRQGSTEWDFNRVRERCVFTRHTPVPAGHDRFGYDLVQRVLGEPVPLDVIRMLGGSDQLDRTHLALNLHFPRKCEDCKVIDVFLPVLYFAVQKRQWARVHGLSFWDRVNPVDRPKRAISSPRMALVVCLGTPAATAPDTTDEHPDH